MSNSKDERRRSPLRDGDSAENFAASEMLEAVGRLFPEALRELESIGRTLIPPVDESPTFNDQPESDAAEGPWEPEWVPAVAAAVSDWAKRHHLTSQTMERAAYRWAVGAVDGDTVDRGRLGPDGEELLPPTIMADPFNETSEAFARRAAAHYQEVDAFWREGGASRGSRNHIAYHYLAAHLVGHHTWAEIAHGHTEFDPEILPRTSEQNVSEQARKIAAILGISLSTKRGPRKGAPRHLRQGNTPYRK
jgi:hypothetical protein